MAASPSCSRTSRSTWFRADEFGEIYEADSKSELRDHLRCCDFVTSARCAARAEVVATAVNEKSGVTSRLTDATGVSMFSDLSTAH